MNEKDINKSVEQHKADLAGLEAYHRGIARDLYSLDRTIKYDPKTGTLRQEKPKKWQK